MKGLPKGRGQPTRPVRSKVQTVGLADKSIMSGEDTNEMELLLLTLPTVQPPYSNYLSIIFAEPLRFGSNSL